MSANSLLSAAGHPARNRTSRADGQALPGRHPLPGKWHLRRRQLPEDHAIARAGDRTCWPSPAETHALELWMPVAIELTNGHPSLSRSQRRAPSWPRDSPLAIGRECHGDDILHVSFKGVNPTAGLGIPQANRGILRTGQNWRPSGETARQCTSPSCPRNWWTCVFFPGRTDRRWTFDPGGRTGRGDH